jgi:hypothetical protein
MRSDACPALAGAAILCTGQERGNIKGGPFSFHLGHLLSTTTQLELANYKKKT